MITIKILGSLFVLIATYLIVIIMFPILRVKKQPMPQVNSNYSVPSCRRNITFEVDGLTLRGWLYLPAKTYVKVPCILLNTGFCGTKDMILEQYALRFVEAGFAAFSFDYRHFGESDGEPRQLYSVRKQIEDARGAIVHLRSLKKIDPDKIFVWGTSAGGNYGIVLAAEDHRIAGVIGQCSSLDHRADMWHVFKQVGIVWMLKLLIHAQRDKGRSRFGLSPHMLPAIGVPGSTAILNVPGTYEGYARIAKTSKLFRNEIVARTIVEPHGPNIIETAKRVTCPMIFFQCENDQIVAPNSHVKIAEATGKLGIFHALPIDHFEIYEGEWFDKIVRMQVDFISRVIDKRPAA